MKKLRKLFTIWGVICITLSACNFFDAGCDQDTAIRITFNKAIEFVFD